MGVGQNPVPPMTLKSPFKGGNLPKRYPIGFDPQPDNHLPRHRFGSFQMLRPGFRLLEPQRRLANAEAAGAGFGGGFFDGKKDVPRGFKVLFFFLFNVFGCFWRF